MSSIISSLKYALLVVLFGNYPFTMELIVRFCLEEADGYSAMGDFMFYRMSYESFRDDKCGQDMTNIEENYWRL